MSATATTPIGREAVQTKHVGVIAIGRNEGERLVRCLASVQGQPLVYVDSGSTDNSVANARAAGAAVVELDLSRPFTAARARNIGFRTLLAQHPHLQWVMFVDGDCEVQSEWLAQALAKAQADPQIAAVCGRRRERFPEASLYNRMCDIEWNTPVGDAKACGGDALYRVAVFEQVGGFDDGFIAGEEPELCFRIRELGYRIERIPVEMTLHDASMNRFGQWWKRTERSGHAYLLNYRKHGQKNAEKFKFREIRSILLWAGIYSALLVLTLLLRSPWPLLLLLLVIVAQAAKMTLSLNSVRQEYGAGATFQYSLFVLIGKWPQALGVLRAYRNSSAGRQHTLVEYK